MKTIVTVSIIGMCLGIASPLWAQVGDVGSPECLAVQLDAQDAVAAGGPYRNHGQMVRTAANTVSPEVDSSITEECSSCIMNQFARRIPIGDQEPCGEEVIACPDDCLAGLAQLAADLERTEYSVLEQSCSYDAFRQAGSIFVVFGDASPVIRTLFVAVSRCQTTSPDGSSYVNMDLTDAEQAACAPVAKAYAEALTGLACDISPQ